jgi:hypothetical protein
MKILKKLKASTRQQVKRKMNAKIARVEGYAQGCEDTSNELIQQIKSLNTTITKLTNENLKVEEGLRQHYEDRTNVLEGRYTEKCKKCMLATEAERDRLRVNQDLILDLIQNFNLVFVKVFKHIAVVVDEHDNMIKSSARIKSSKEILMGIKSEAEKIIQRVLPLTPISQTETLLHLNGNSQNIHRLSSNSKQKSSK